MKSNMIVDETIAQYNEKNYMMVLPSLAHSWVIDALPSNALVPGSST